ncbi:MAG TPA: DUF2892 domain-containing protein [Bacteroidales bacterium]|nr:DUF2892 domain-containing protein [Bacteroidales bacterium]HNZ43459.1 DUF2892 domain-containing protein [Bacteroidales bacterium]HOH84216.1 DUF2892 domain-containing protein [Bacteroidales bacterium]HPB26430.1 DUF2892 domain-containing protein [Bacteroidales bacterium]HQN16656.1 DUF2892 domain-containing protein [Bacteroidales bacterium]
MKNNMGLIDKAIRFVMAIVIIVLYATQTLPNDAWWSYLLLLLAAFFVITSLLSFCPLYLPFKIDTRSHDIKKQESKK